MAKITRLMAPLNVKDSADDSPLNCVSDLIIRDIFIQSITSIRYLFAETAPEIHVPDLESLKDGGVDFMKLSEAYEAYEEAGLEPEFILSPVNLSPAGWKKIYSNLSVWQDINDPRSPNKLQPNGGLWPPDSIGDHYNESIRDDLRSLSGRRILSEGGEAIGDDGLPTNTVVWQTALIQAGGTKNMPIGQYLTLQAERLYQKRPPIEWAGLLRYGDEQ
jgi:hypothetical protein